jgi:hypothetical protein
MSKKFYKLSKQKGILRIDQYGIILVTGFSFTYLNPDK